MFCLFNLAYINPSIPSHECTSKFKFCINSYSNEMITDHKDVVSNCGNAVCLLDRKIVLLLEFKK